MKKVFSIVFLICCLLAWGCGNDDSNIEPEAISIPGTWYWSFQDIVSCDEPSNDVGMDLFCDGDCLIYVFEEDGTGQLIEQPNEQTMALDWQLNGTVITIDLANGETDLYILTDDNRLLIKSVPTTINMTLDPTTYGKGCEMFMFFEKVSE